MSLLLISYSQLTCPCDVDPASGLPGNAGAPMPPHWSEYSSSNNSQYFHPTLPANHPSLTQLQHKTTSINFHILSFSLRIILYTQNRTSRLESSPPAREYCVLYWNSCAGPFWSWVCWSGLGSGRGGVGAGALGSVPDSLVWVGWVVIASISFRKDIW